MDANQQPDEAYRGADPFAVLRSRTSSRARAPGCSKGMTAERSAFANANPRDKLWVITGVPGARQDVSDRSDRRRVRGAPATKNSVLRASASTVQPEPRAAIFSSRPLMLMYRC
jgi:hypothetical protein